MNPLSTVRGALAAGIALAVAIALADGIAFFDLGFIVWLHVLAGIVWIGMLYYFNFVQGPALAEAASDTAGPGGSAITRYVAPRALAWFRWGAVATWLTGAAALARLGIFDDAFLLGFNAGAAPNAYVIGVGAWLDTIMLLNVWLLIWPNQKKVLGLVEATAEQIGRARRTALLASRANVALSLPMLMSMVGYGHRGFFV